MIAQCVVAGVVPEYQCAVKREAKKAQKEKDRPNSSSLGSPDMKEPEIKAIHQQQQQQQQQQMQQQQQQQLQQHIHVRQATPPVDGSWSNSFVLTIYHWGGGSRPGVGRETDDRLRPCQRWSQQRIARQTPQSRTGGAHQPARLFPGRIRSAVRRGPEENFGAFDSRILHFLFFLCIF